MIFNNRKAKGIPHLSIKRETEPPALTKDMYLIMINKTESWFKLIIIKTKSEHLSKMTNYQMGGPSLKDRGYLSIDPICWILKGIMLQNRTLGIYLLL
jgi:hypothetical protein